MKLVNLEAALNKRPFRPFELRIDGAVVRVGHPEQVLFAEGKSTAIVVDPQDHVHILDVDHISKLQLLPRRDSSATGPGSPHSG
jgi:hypothetical protein